MGYGQYLGLLGGEGGEAIFGPEEFDGIGKIIFWGGATLVAAALLAGGLIGSCIAMAIL